MIPNFNSLKELNVQEYERYLPTAFDESMSILEKLNKVIEYLNQIGHLKQEEWNIIESMLTKKEDSINISNNRKLSPTGNFTGTIHGRNSLKLAADVDDNGDKISYLTNKFSDGQTGFVIDGGFFDEDGIRDNYNGGVF